LPTEAHFTDCLKRFYCI